MHLPPSPAGEGRLLAMSVERDRGSSTDDAEMYIWECITQRHCKFPRFHRSLQPQITLSFELFSLPEEDESSSRKSPVSYRWEKAKARAAENRERSMRLHKAKEEKKAKKQDLGTQTQLPPYSGEMANSCGSWLVEGPPSLTDTILQECAKNLTKERPSYSNLTYEVAMIFYLTSAKLYKLIRKVFVFPSVSSLYRAYSEQLRTNKERLTDLSKISLSLCQVREGVAALNPLQKTVDCQFTLAVDAFSFQSFIAPVAKVSDGNEQGRIKESQTLDDVPDERKEKDRTIPQSQVELRYGFIMMLIPLDYRLPAKIVHLATSPAGSYSKDIGLIVDQVRQACNAAGLRVWFKATDGDPGVSQEHEAFYEHHVCGRDGRFASLVDKTHTWLRSDNSSYIPIADPLHVLKNIRSRLITYPIQLYPNSRTSEISEMREILKIGPALSDESQIGKMRDSYVTQLFTFENVQRLLRKGQYVHGFLILPFACWTTILFCPRISLKLRLFLVELAYHIIRQWMEQFPQLNKAGVMSRGSTSHNAITFSDRHHARRMLNTLTAFGVALSFGRENLRMDSLGTHLVENSIGLARAVSNGDARYERVLTAYAHADLRKELSANMGIRLHVPGRINDGGCKLDPTLELSKAAKATLVKKPKAWRVDDLIRLAQAACCTDTGAAMKKDVDQFASELNDLASVLDVRHYHIGSVANSCIMARLIQFGSHDTQKTEQ